MVGLLSTFERSQPTARGHATRPLRTQPALLPLQPRTQLSKQSKSPLQLLTTDHRNSGADGGCR
jgi:hypothetical protein